MSDFTDYDPAALSLIPKGRPWSRQQYRLERNLEWYYDENGIRKYVVVPRGFVTDLASIPGLVKLLFWWLIKGWDAGHKSAILHDWLYRTDPGGRGKHWADYQFFDALIAEGVPISTADRMFAAVDRFGNRAWKKRRKA